MAENVVKFDFLARDKFSPTADKIAGKTDSLAGKVAKFGKTAAIAFGAAAAGGVVVLGKAFLNGFQAADKFQALGLKTAAVIKSTGNQAHISVGGVQKLAAELESLGTTDEELIINSQNVLATFTNIRNVGKDKIFDQATRSTLDMSVALGTDLQGASIQVGKALNDPIKGVTALQRVGVSFTDAQKDQIKAMVEAGDTMGAQKLILGELNKEFGGAAKAAGSGFGGALFRAKDAVGDLQRDIAAKAMPVLTDMADWFTTKGVPKLRAFSDWMGTKGIPAITDGFRTARDAAVGVWKKFDISGIGKRLSEQAGAWGGTIIAGVKTGLDTGDWSGLGVSLGEGLSKAITAGASGAAKLGAAIGKWFAGIDWFAVGAAAGLAAAPFIVGFSKTLVEGLINVAKEHPLDTLLFVASIIPIGKLFAAFGPLRNFLLKLPFGKWIVSALDHSVVPVFDRVWGFVKFIGRAFAAGFRSVFPGLEGALARRIRGMADGIGLRALYAADKAKDFVWGIAAGIGKGAGRVIKAIALTIWRLTTPFRKADDWLISAGRQLVGGLLDGVANGLNAVARAASTVISRATRPFRRAGSWLYQSGRELLRGLRDGMLNGVQAAGSWASNIGGRIVRAVKNFFGIRSPSRVFAGIGKNLISSMLGAMIQSNPTQMITKIFGGMPNALGALVNKGMIGVGNLPSKAINALSGLGGKFASMFGGPGGSGLVAFGKWLQSQGYTVTEHPAFGGVGEHSVGSAHYSGRAIDVNHGAGTSALEQRFLRFIVAIAQSKGFKTIFMSPGHYNHAHIAYDEGGVATGRGFMAKRTIEPERVLSPKQTRDFSQLVRVLDRRPVAASPGAGSEPIDYPRLGDSVAKAFVRAGVSVRMDGQAVGRVMGQSASLLGRAG